MIPEGITTALVHMDAPVSFVGEKGRLHVTIEPSVSLIWTATGTPMGNFTDTLNLDPGAELQVDLPHTDQPGFQDAAGNAYTGWYYSVTVVYEKGGRRIAFPKRDFQIPAGQVEVDLALVPTGEAAPVPSVAPILPVTSIGGLTGAVTKSQLGIDKVSNTSDAEKAAGGPIKAALDAKLDDAQLGAASGVAPLDAGSRVPQANLPTHLTPAELGNTYTTKTASAAKKDVVDRGQRLMAKLDNGQGDAVLAVTTDSTGFDSTAWVRKLADYFAAKYPKLKVVYNKWDDPAKALISTTVQAGTPNTDLSTIIDDRFDRTAADILGTTPTLGLSNWEYQSGSTNWDVVGTAAKATAGTYGKVLISSGQGGETYTTWTYKAIAVPTTTAQMRFYVKSGLFFSDSIVELRIIRGPSTWTATMNKTINGVGAQIATTGNTAIPADGIYNIQMRYKPGPNASVTATINGVTLTANISDADDALLAPYTRHGFGAISADTVGDEIRLFQVKAPEAATLQTLTIFNGTMPGANLAYHTTWFASMFPNTPDAMIISMGHNYNNVTVADFMPIYQAYVDKVRAAFPNAGIIISSQNPEASPRPVTGRTLHGARNIELRAYAEAKGFGYIPVFEEFTRRKAEWINLIQADGVHLTHGTGQGDDVWAAVSNTHFDALNYATLGAALLTSPNGARYRLTVGDDGALTTTAL